MSEPTQARGIFDDSLRIPWRRELSSKWRIVQLLSMAALSSETARIVTLGQRPLRLSTEMRPASSSPRSARRQDLELTPNFATNWVVIGRSSRLLLNPAWNQRASPTAGVLPGNRQAANHQFKGNGPLMNKPNSLDDLVGDSGSVSTPPLTVGEVLNLSMPTQGSFTVSGCIVIPHLQSQKTSSRRLSNY